MSTEKLKYLTVAILVAVTIYYIPDLIKSRIFVDTWVLNAINKLH